MQVGAAIWMTIHSDAYNFVIHCFNSTQTCVGNQLKMMQRCSLSRSALPKLGKVRQKKTSLASNRYSSPYIVLQEDEESV